MNNNELTYWITLAHMPKMWSKRKNEIVVDCFNQGISIIDFFETESIWQTNLHLTAEEILMFNTAKKQLANNAFLVEDILNQGYEITPITSKDYSKLLKSNLKYVSPLVLYSKGNRDVMQESSIAIVGSRNADEISLTFADNVARNAAAENCVVVSGFAKGIDRQALDSSVNAEGKSIIVLPQGITTFGSGFKQYFKQISSGRVLVVSTFHPKSPWSVENAMARNPIIYAMAEKIFVAQSDLKGGTWSGVMDGLKKGRNIFVRKPEPNEKNANNLLISQGTVPVDMFGKPITLFEEKKENTSKLTEKSLDESIMDILSKGTCYSAKQINEKLQLSGWTDAKLREHLKKMDTLELHKGKVLKFSLKSTHIQPTLF